MLCSLRRAPPACTLSRKVNHVVLNCAGHFQSRNIAAVLAELLNSFFLKSSCNIYLVLGNESFILEALLAPAEQE